MVVVRVRGPLQQLADGEAEHTVEAATVAEALRELERAHPAVSGWILDERGRVRRHINVFVNGEQADPEARLGASDRVEVLPAISGG